MTFNPLDDIRRDIEKSVLITVSNSGINDLPQEYLVIPGQVVNGFYVEYGRFDISPFSTLKLGA